MLVKGAYGYITGDLMNMDGYEKILINATKRNTKNSVQIQ